MARLIIHHFSDDLLRKLKTLAKANGRSAEEEAHEILKTALKKDVEPLTALVGSGKQTGRTAKEIDSYVRKLRSEW